MLITRLKWTSFVVLLVGVYTQEYLTYMMTDCPLHTVPCFIMVETERKPRKNHPGDCRSHIVSHSHTPKVEALDSVNGYFH